jgi:heme oxygenase
MSHVPIMDRLRRETADEHQRVERLPFFEALAAAEVPLASYAGLLDALRIVHESLEREISSRRERFAPFGRVWDVSLSKLTSLDADLADLGADRPAGTPAATLRAHLLSQRVRQRAEREPVSLLGYLYVLEGSTLGGTIVAMQVARAFGLDRGRGARYLSGYGKATKANWTAFSERMNAALARGADHEAVVSGAREAFAGIAGIVSCLHPLELTSSRDRVRVLNPEAGSHPIPDDPREIQAALRAGEHTWRTFPYYEQRYGARGEQFTRSDSAWLVTLARHEAAVVEQQIRWLAEVLASRGMPSWLLELHLGALCEELAAAVPERAEAYERLRAAAAALRAARERFVDAEALARSIAAFDARVRGEWSRRLPRTGGLLAAAVADEKNGIVQAVPSLESWMTDAARFPSDWIDAVRVTLREARGP